jgi:hypothetical protein
VNLDQTLTPGSGEDVIDQAASRQSQALTFWLRSSNFDRDRLQACGIVRRLLEHNPHTTLQIVLEPLAELSCLSAATLEALERTGLEQPSYLDKFYAVLPGSAKGAKRLVILLPDDQVIPDDWRQSVEPYAFLFDAARAESARQLVLP